MALAFVHVRCHTHAQAGWACMMRLPSFADVLQESIFDYTFIPSIQVSPPCFMWFRMETSS